MWTVGNVEVGNIDSRGQLGFSKWQYKHKLQVVKEFLITFMDNVEV